MIETVHLVAEPSVDSTGRRVYRKPSLAGKLGHSLKKCAQLKLGLAIRQSDLVMKQEANAFLYLPVERELLKRMDMVQIPGKRLNAVPVLLTPDVKAAMDVLLETRSAVGIPTTNQYFFPSYSKHGHLDACQVIQKIVSLAGVQHPERITTTKLKLCKYVGTMMQLLDLTNTELDWLSSHLGHTLNIHKSFYRQHTSAVEIGKVTRLLMQVENGQPADYSGKT